MRISTGRSCRSVDYETTPDYEATKERTGKIADALCADTQTNTE